METLKKFSDNIEFLNRNIKPVTTDYNQFEKNCRNEFKVRLLDRNLSMLKEHQSFIGKNVHKRSKSFSHVMVTEEKTLESFEDVFNKIDKEPVLFTEDMFEKFKLDYINYQVEYHTRALLSQSITSNSTCKLSNLIFEWQLECKQELIAFYNELLGKY